MQPCTHHHEIRIRPAALSDCQALAHIQVDSYRSAYAGILPQDYLGQFSYEAQSQDWCDLLSREDGDPLLVAETAGGEVVGYSLGRVGLTTIPPYDGEVAALHVRRQYQQQGIGRLLLGAMAERLEQAGCTAVMLWVLEENPARRFYEHLGGKLIGRQQVELGDGLTATEVAYGWMTRVGSPSRVQPSSTSSISG